MIKKRKKKIFAIILTYNCEQLLKKTYEKLPKRVFDRVILVDDHSSDKTMQVAKSLGIEAYTHKHTGYGGNIKFGLQKAYKMGADYMVEIHGDGQFDSRIAPQAIKKMDEGFDLLLGSRFINIKQPLKDGMPMSRYITNIVTSYISRIVLGLKLTEVHNGFHVFNRRFIEEAGFKNTSQGHIYSFEILAQAKYHELKVTEIPVRCDYIGKHTSMDILESVPYLYSIFKVLFQYLLTKFDLKVGLFK